MLSRGVLLGLLSAAALLYIATAQDLPYLVILPLYNGGQLSYLTTPTKATAALNFQKPLVPKTETDVSYLRQYFQPSDGYPSSFTLFSWSDQTLFLDSTGGSKFSLMPESGLPTQKWMVDSWGRLCTIDMKYMAQYSLSNGYGGPLSTFTLVPYSEDVKGVNQFTFAPNSAVLTDATISYLLPMYGNNTQLCVDSNPLKSLVIGAANTPKLTVCEYTNAQQGVQLLPPSMDGNSTVDAFPSLFRIKFAATGLCLSLSPPFGTIKNSGRQGNTVLQVHCDATYSETTWRWNTRGQLQSFVQLSGSVNQAIWVCLNYNAATNSLVGDSCSLKLTNNRFNVL